MSDILAERGIAFEEGKNSHEMKLSDVTMSKTCEDCQKPSNGKKYQGFNRDGYAIAWFNVSTCDKCFIKRFSNNNEDVVKIVEHKFDFE